MILHSKQLLFSKPQISISSLILDMDANNAPVNNIWYSKVNDGNGFTLNNVNYDSTNKYYTINSGYLSMLKTLGKLSENGCTIIAKIQPTTLTNTVFFNFNHTGLNNSRNMFSHLPYSSNIYFDAGVGAQSRISSSFSALKISSVNSFNYYIFQRINKWMAIGSNGNIISQKVAPENWIDNLSTLSFGIIGQDFNNKNQWYGNIKSFQVYNKILDATELIQACSDRT